MGGLDSGVEETHSAYMIKNYIEKYSQSGEFEKPKVKLLVWDDLQEMMGETQGPVTRTESIFILISIAINRDLEFKINITAADVNTLMSDNVKHKWLMLDKDVAAVLMSLERGEKHGLVLSPKSMQLVAKSDASSTPSM